MKCIKDKCERYIYSDHQDWCTIDNHYIGNNEFCNIINHVLHKQDDLNYLQDLEKSIVDNQ